MTGDLHVRLLASEWSDHPDYRPAPYGPVADCPCRSWAGDMRIPRPDGHHPKCDGTGEHKAGAR